MATLAQIMDEIAVQIRATVAAVTDIQVQVEGRTMIAPTVPCVDLLVADPSDDQDLAAFGEMIGGELLQIRVRVSTADTNAGQDLLLAFMDDQDPLGIVNAITDPTLGGRASTLHFRSRSGYREFPDLGGEGSWLGCLFDLVVVKSDAVVVSSGYGGSSYGSEPYGG